MKPQWILPAICGVAALLGPQERAEADFLLPAETQSVAKQRLRIMDLPLSFQRYDNSQGDLLGVQITIEAALEVTVIAEFTGSGSQVIDVTVSSTVSAGPSDDGALSYVALPLSVTKQAVLTESDPSLVDTQVAAGSAFMELTSPVDLAAFTMQDGGPDTVDVLFQFLGETMIGESTGSGLREVSSFGSGMVTIQYLVPEPSGALLALVGGSGFAAIGLWRRRRKPSPAAISD